jgi:hypothetical protein
LAFWVDTFRDTKNSGVAAYRLAGDEDAALRWLEEAPGDGGVLARDYFGAAVPALTGRDTWVGHFAWTPDHDERRRMADELFAGRLADPGARALVRSSGAEFLLSGCGDSADLEAALGDLVRRRREFGCATVYEVATAR